MHFFNLRLIPFCLGGPAFFLLAIGVGTGDTPIHIGTPEVDVEESICMNVSFGCVGCVHPYAVQVGRWIQLWRYTILFNIPCDTNDTNAFLQLSMIGLDPPSTVEMEQLDTDLQHTYQFGLPIGRYRIKWDFQITIGYAFIRQVSSTTGVCNYTGMGKTCHFQYYINVMR